MSGLPGVNLGFPPKCHKQVFVDEARRMVLSSCAQRVACQVRKTSFVEVSPTGCSLEENQGWEHLCAVHDGL